MSDLNEKKPRDFIREIIDRDISEGKHNGRVHTRFPPASITARLTSGSTTPTR